MDQERSKRVPPPQESGRVNGLTPIHQRILAATPDTDENESELDQIAVDDFLDTLADVVLAIARRRQRLEQ